MKYSTSDDEPKAITDMPGSRVEAVAAKEPYFFTGIPCKRGHVAPRYTSSPICVECAKIAYAKRRTRTLQELKAAYQANPEKYRAKERAHALSDPKKYWAKHVLKNARIRADKAGVPFELTKKYLMSILPEVCPVFGTPFVYVGNGRLTPESATLDRIHPAKGYTLDNVVVISNKANTIKSAYDAVDIRKVADWLERNS
jgi:hypothetical protein